MIARRSVLVGVPLALVLAAVDARAADSSAKSFVEAIYAPYKGKNARGTPLDSDAAVRRYFEPQLAALIIKDRKDARGEVPTLDSDPFIDAQDWEIDAFDIAVHETAADQARAHVTFKNFDKTTNVVLDLVKLKLGWRIADITWDRDASQRGLLSKK
jgi:Protein of unknown function (DUF3828)